LGAYLLADSSSVLLKQPTSCVHLTPDILNIDIDCQQPGCLYYLSAWYTRKELVKRTAVLYSGSLLSGAFSGLIAAGITNGLNGAKGLSAWRWLFIVEGALTVNAQVRQK
jgi:hypothetical protein